MTTNCRVESNDHSASRLLSSAGRTCTLVKTRGIRDATSDGCIFQENSIIEASDTSFLRMIND